ncbi:MAG: hypothetical protein HZB26_22660 [Candidatus Hydrogenedentes bacterium]|nr:hypothetical protein [Candidatus Hydrogenedentota bacterium]
MATFDLSTLHWSLYGWRPFVWRLGKSRETGGVLGPDLGPFEADVPGSVQAALLRAGVIADWNAGVNSRSCEWVEHRHWDFSAYVPEGAIAQGEAVLLVAQGLDYSGWILVDCKEAAAFSGALVPHHVDLTEALGDGLAHQLSVIFEEPPREQGQFGYSSRSHFFKPRYGYSWDWTPRIVPIGPWNSLTLRTGAELAFEILSVNALLEANDHTGSVEITLEYSDRRLPGPCEAQIALVDNGVEVSCAVAILTPGQNRIALKNLLVAPWWPNGHGDQKLYDVVIAAGNSGAAFRWEQRRRVGFRRIEWRPCEGAPADAEPWICVVNGKPIFLQGINWVPPRSVYHDATVDEYVKLIDLYREMGCTCIRVWGGGIIEREIFFDRCDESGILVWQEFPLSSSGVDNAPPSSPEAISTLCEIARSYIRQRGHHASLLLWCGGNELQVMNDGAEVPAGYDHPCLAALRDVVRGHDPDRRFVPTSASGPAFYAHKENFGKGIHHDVHGPWGMGGFADLAAWRDYWAHDDALFRSEVGMPGAEDEQSIRRHAGEDFSWPPEGEYWTHTAAWWIEWTRWKDILGNPTLADYVAATQEHQAEAYAAAAASCKNRFPRCGGFIIWMGHDCFPCPVNNSVIDFDAKPKPAYYALQKVFRSGR